MLNVMLIQAMNETFASQHFIKNLLTKEGTLVVQSIALVEEPRSTIGSACLNGWKCKVSFDEVPPIAFAY